MEAIPLCDIIIIYIYIYIYVRHNNNSQQYVLQINSAWLHVSAAHGAIFRPALDRTSTFDVRTS